MLLLLGQVCHGQGKGLKNPKKKKTKYCQSPDIVGFLTPRGFLCCRCVEWKEGSAQGSRHRRNELVRLCRRRQLAGKAVNEKVVWV